MHSCAGLAGSEAVPEEISCGKRKAQNLLGGVVHLFLSVAFVLQDEQSVLGAFGESPNNDVEASLLLAYLLRSCAL